MSQKFKLERHLPTLLSLWRGGKGESLPLSPAELAKVSSSLLALQRGLTGGRKLVGASYMERKDYLGAYLLYYWPVSYMQLSFILHGLAAQEKLRFSCPLRILDVGSGPAPASAAVCDCLPVSELELADSSPQALALAERLFKADFPSVKVRAEVCDIREYSPPQGSNYDIILMSHALNELWAGEADMLERRIELAEKFARALAPDGILLFVEPALQETSRSLLAVRDGLLPRSEGIHIIAPCPADGVPCPALCASSQSCHAEISWQAPEPVASLALHAGLDRHSVKMAFCAFSKRDTEPTGKFRVVSDAMLNKAGRLRYLLCDGKRRIALSAPKGDSHAKEIGFFSLKRYDMIELRKPELRGNGENPAYGVGLETELAIF